PLTSNVFSLAFSEDARQVKRLELPPPNYAGLAVSRRHFSNLIPARIPQAPSNLIDLTDSYNPALVQSCHLVPRNNRLDILPCGLLQLGGTVFDVRGIIQLSGLQLQRVGGRFPQQLSGIRVGQKCAGLHFLQATGWAEQDGTRVGMYLVHYTDGRM